MRTCIIEGMKGAVHVCHSDTVVPNPKRNDLTGSDIFDLAKGRVVVSTVAIPVRHLEAGEDDRI